jgi:AcrR family transcriptional regulator
VTPPNPERRSERARSAILSAALELCSEQGYADTTMEGIAKRAGVGKQTIYRWWPSKAAVLQEALNEYVGAGTDFPDTGDIVADLRTQMTAVANLFASKRFSPYWKGLIAAAQNDPEIARSVASTMIAPRVRACRQRLEHAVEQRQMRADVDLDDVVELVYAPLYYRLLLQTRPITTQQVDHILELAFTGLNPRRSRARKTVETRNRSAEGSAGVQ